MLFLLKKSKKLTFSKCLPEFALINYILIILPIYYMNSGKNNLFLCFYGLCKAKTYLKKCVIV